MHLPPIHSSPRTTSEKIDFGSDRDKAARGYLFPIVAYLLAILIPIHFFAGPLYITSLRLLLLFFAIPLTINLIRGKYGGILPVDILFMGYMAWMQISLFINSPESLVSQFGSTSVEFFVGYLFGRAFIRSRLDFVFMLKVLSAVIAITIPFAAYEAITGNPIIIQTIRKIPGITSEPINNYGTRLGLYRSQVILAHPIHYGLLCSSLFSLVFVGLKGQIGNGTRYAVSALALAGVFLSLSSGAILPTVLQIFFILWYYIFISFSKRWVLLASIFVIAYILVDLASNRDPLRVFMSYATFSSDTAYWRQYIFEWGMYNVWENPAFGIGLNDWVRPDWMFTSSMDNFWLVNAVRFGIPGFLFLLAGVVYAVTKAAIRKIEGDQSLQNLRLAWVFCIISFSISLTTVHIWATIYSYFFFLFGSGIWLIGSKKAQGTCDEGEGGNGNPRLNIEKVEKGKGDIRYTRFDNNTK